MCNKPKGLSNMVVRSSCFEKQEGLLAFKRHNCLKE